METAWKDQEPAHSAPLTLSAATKHPLTAQQSSRCSLRFISIEKAFQGSSALAETGNSLWIPDPSANEDFWYHCHEDMPSPVFPSHRKSQTPQIPLQLFLCPSTIMITIVFATARWSHPVRMQLSSRRPWAAQLLQRIVHLWQHLQRSECIPSLASSKPSLKHTSRQLFSLISAALILQWPSYRSNLDHQELHMNVLRVSTYNHWQTTSDPDASCSSSALRPNFTPSTKDNGRIMSNPTPLYTSLKQVWFCAGHLWRPGKRNSDTAVWNHTQLYHSKGSHYKTFIAPIREAKWQMTPVKSLQSGPKSSTTPFCVN